MVEGAPDGRPEEQASRRQLRWDLKQVAAVAFLAGILLHACVLAALLDNGGGGQSSADEPVEVRPASPTRVASATPLADRRNCAEIRGTDYRSESERQWFIANCL